jgi:hypothetical protein
LSVASQDSNMAPKQLRLGGRHESSWLPFVLFCADLNSDANNCKTCGNKCGASAPKCSSATCVQCTGSGVSPDCPGKTICQSNQCICPNTDSACDATCTACTRATPKCSTAGHCVQCTSDSNCSGNASHCLLSSNTCVEYTSDGQCGGNKVCQSNHCVCAAGTCGSSCIACSGTTPVCSSSGQCVECATASQCGTGKTCNGSFSVCLVQVRERAQCRPARVCPDRRWRACGQAQLR